MVEVECDETYKDERKPKETRRVFDAVRTDSPCRLLSAGRYADHFLSLTSPDVLKAKVTGLLVCVVFMWLGAASQSLPLLYNFDSLKVHFADSLHDKDDEVLICASAAGRNVCCA